MILYIQTKLEGEFPLFLFVKAFQEKLLFLIRFFQSPETIGSIFPSSDALTSKLVTQIVPSRSPKKYLEVGAGTGAVTDAIIKKLGPKDTLDVVESDHALCSLLKNKYKNPNIKIYEKSIEDFEESDYDGIISSLPFNQFSLDFVKGVFFKYLKMMKPGGFLSYYEYKYPKVCTRLLTEHRQRLEKIRDFKTEVGQKFHEKIEPVWWNLPPADVRSIQKQGSSTL
jgi:phospholipid N-methyltransferase